VHHDTPTPITTLELPVLLGELREHTAQILALIDADPMLKRRTRPDGLTIVNSGPGLFEPQWMHQLYAKGLVYAKDPWRVVSLPLVKMFNHGRREHSDGTTDEVLARDEISFVFPEKLDGTMIQLFQHSGETILTTRSVIEGLGDEKDADYVRLAREVLSGLYPQLLDPKAIGERSMIFELVHPKTQQVTRYGARKAMVLLSIYDHASWRYVPTAEVLDVAGRLKLEAPGVLSTSGASLAEHVHAMREALAGDPTFPEGSIVCFEDGHQIVHRVKVKTAEYLEQFAMRYSISYKSVVEMIWDRPELHDWDAFLAHLIAEELSEEEVEAFYREYFDQFIAWRAEITATHEAASGAFAEWVERHGEVPADDAVRKGYLKALAAWTKQHHSDYFPLVMHAARRGGLTVRQVMWANPAIPGMREMLR